MQAPICRNLLKRTTLMLGAGAIALVTAGTAPAQTRPMDRRGDDPIIRDREVIRHDRDDGGYRGGRYDRNSDYPASEVHDAVDANARTAFARAQYRRAQDALNAAIRDMQYNFEHSAEMADALKAEQRAWEDYVAARNAALRSVVSDPKYQANVAEKNEMTDRIAEARGSYDVTLASTSSRAAVVAVDQMKMKEIVNLAIVKLNYAQVATDMEVAALKNDSKVADARGRLMSAGARVQSMRDDFDRKVRASQELAAIRNKIEDSRVALITAEAYRNGAVEAANDALDYAYYKNRYTYNYNTLGYPYDYGYGAVLRY
jgi:hypothetical protein